MKKITTEFATIFGFIKSRFPRSQEQLSKLRAERLIARTALKRAGLLGFKPVSSAKWTNIKRDWTGKLYIQIEHDSIKGCSPEMMRWWFENLGKTTNWDGVGFDGPEASFYHLWHHKDHVAVTPLTKSSSGFSNGGRTRIQEQFNDYCEQIYVDTTTDRLDNEEFTFTVRIMGVVICRIFHFYSPDQDGLQFYAETQVGMETPVFGWLFNWIILPFIYSKKTGEHWVRHNIEETGQSEGLIATLYNHYTQ